MAENIRMYILILFLIYATKAKPASEDFEDLLEELKKDLTEVYQRGTDGRHLKLGAFNIQILGVSKYSKTHVREALLRVTLGRAELASFYIV